MFSVNYIVTIVVECYKIPTTFSIKLFACAISVSIQYSRLVWMWMLVIDLKVMCRVMGVTGCC